MEILIATKNKHKAEELGTLLAGLAEALSLTEWEARNKKTLAEPLEDGESFVDNALIKARAYARESGLVSLADDSGLSVAALDGAPGVYSARYGGPGLSDHDRCLRLLAEMEGRHDRRAFFSSVLALAAPDGRALYWEGRAEGLIRRSLRGERGFGYDPLFFYPPSGRSFAELTMAEKNSVSHRALASRLFLDDLSRVRRFLGYSVGR